MSDSANSVTETVATLRRSFDSVFQEPVQLHAADTLHLLAVRIGGATFALNLAELAGLVPAPRIIPIPDQPPAMLGLAAVKARVVSAYSLAALVGERADKSEVMRWIALSGRDPSVGLAFGQFERCHLVERSRVGPVTAGAPPHVVGMIAAAPSPLWIVSVPSITAEGSIGGPNSPPAGKGEG